MGKSKEYFTLLREEEYHREQLIETKRRLRDCEEMIEIWRDIKDYEGLYQVSNLGRVKSLARIRYNGHERGHQLNEIIRKPYAGKVGYLTVTLCKNGKHKNCTIHRLVAQAFIPNPENKGTVNHIDGDKHNNNVFNLEWNTMKENSRHAFRTGLNDGNKFSNEKNGKTKLSKEQVIEIRNKYVPKIYTLKMLGDEYGVGESTIGHIIRKRRRNYD